MQGHRVAKMMPGLVKTRERAEMDEDDEDDELVDEVMLEVSSDCRKVRICGE